MLKAILAPWTIKVLFIRFNPAICKLLSCSFPTYLTFEKIKKINWINFSKFVAKKKKERKRNHIIKHRKRLIKVLTTKLVLPIWQSPNKLIFKETKSESVSYPLLNVLESSTRPVSIVSGAGEDSDDDRRVNFWYLTAGCFPIEQTRILSQINRKNLRKIDTLSNKLRLIFTWTTLLQSWVMFSVASWIILAIIVAVAAAAAS